MMDFWSCGESWQELSHRYSEHLLDFSVRSGSILLQSQGMVITNSFPHTFEIHQYNGIKSAVIADSQGWTG
jgi:hypothetical protein